MDEELIRQTVQAVLNESKALHVLNASPQILPSQQSDKMSLKLAKALIEKVEQEAAGMGLRVVIAVADAAGRPVAVHCMDGAYIGSFDVALNKTYTAVAFQMSTRTLGELSRPGADLYGIQYTNEGKIVILGGGELLEADGKIIGAIGVSGASAQQDNQLAVYGRDSFKEVSACR